MISRNVRTMVLGAALSLLVAGAAYADDPAAKATPQAVKPVMKPVGKGKMTPVNEVAVMETSKGRMVVEFWDKDAPATVANFKKLARQGFYDGTGFHRILKGFMIQSHSHVKGVLSMANTGTPNSAGSQFFVMHGTAPHLDGHYTAFGHLISGMDVLDKIANSPTGPNPTMPGENSKPMEWTVLKSVKIMSRSAYMAMAKPAVKKTEAAKPGEPKPAETKSSMGGGGGMDMGAGQTTSSPGQSSTSGQASGHPGHDTVEKAKDATQPTTPPSNETQGGGESGN